MEVERTVEETQDSHVEHTDVEIEKSCKEFIKLSLEKKFYDVT